jgi:hypothetical protein
MSRAAITLMIGTGGLVALLATSHATAQPEVEAGTLERLKRTYLVCGYTASVRRLMPSEVSLCAEAADALLEQGFDGNHDRLLVWWHAQRARWQAGAETRPSS